MSAGSPKRQSRLTPYLLVILAVLAGYFLYTRVLAPAPVVAPPQPLPPVVVTPPAPEVTPTPPAVVGVRPRVELPPRAVGRGNPFTPLVVPPQAVAVQPVAPLPPPVPPPLFPVAPEVTPAPEVAPTPPPPAARVAGILRHDDTRMAIVEIAGKTYIVRVGDIVEGFRVTRIGDTTVVLRRGELERELELGGREQP